MSGRCLLVLIGLKLLVMMNSLQNIVISGAQSLLMLMESKFFDKDDQATKHYDIRTMFCGLVIYFKSFDPINIRRLWAPEVTMFFSVFIMTKTFKPIRTRRHWLPIWFNIFFSKACFSSWLFLFYTWDFLIWFHFFFDSSGLRLASSMTSYSKSPF